MDSVLKTRTITGVIFAIVVLGLLYLGKIGILSLCGVVFIISSFEYLELTNSSKSKLIIGIIVALWLTGLCYIFNFSEKIRDVVLYVSITVYALLHLSLFTTKKIPHESILPYFIVFYPGLSLLLPFVFNQEDIFQPMLWYSILILIWTTDVAAYLVGRKLGRRKLFERLSPKKSIEGSIGAGIFAIIVAIILSKYSGLNYSMSFWILMALTIWVTGTCGDLFESSIKRMFDKKDSGTLLPGHGGFLDRFDSFIFVLPFVFLLLKIYNII